VKWRDCTPVSAADEVCGGNQKDCNKERSKKNSRSGWKQNRAQLKPRPSQKHIRTMVLVLRGTRQVVFHQTHFDAGSVLGFAVVGRGSAAHAQRVDAIDRDIVAKH
jgi:hypothetical protein